MKYIIVLFSLMMSHQAFAHGTDEPGPHGGFIQMPGSFHTEVVPDAKNSYSIHLLDMNFQNATVKNSEVKAWLAQGSKKSELKCKVVGVAYFNCTPSDSNFKGQQLIVKAKRDGAQGNEAVYKLPLKHSGKQ